jgi:hypothetical protein
MRLTVATVLLLAVPFTVHAQIAPRTPPSDGHIPGGIIDVRVRPSHPTIGRELRETRDRIDRGRDNGDLSKREARALRREATQIGTLADRYGQDGISEAEHRELEMRTRVLQSQVDIQRIRQNPSDPD